MEGMRIASSRKSDKQISSGYSLRGPSFSQNGVMVVDAR